MKYLLVTICINLIVLGCSSRNKNIEEASFESDEGIRTIQGIITDDNNNPLEKSIITVHKPNLVKPIGTISDEFGRFILKIPNEVSEIKVSFPNKSEKIITIDEKEEYIIILHDSI